MKFLLTFISVLFFTSAFSQDYPRIEKDSLNNDVVVLTIEQAQKLDNDTDLLNLYKSLDDECAKQESICIQVVNDKDAVIASQKLEISALIEYSKNKAAQITVLQKQITEYQNNNSILQKEFDNRQKVITEKDLQIGILKSKFKWTGIGAAAIITVLTSILLIK
jgi:hypothetical protein